MSLSSKYAVSLYENLAQWVGLSNKISQNFSLEDFRQLLGVQDEKYRLFGELNAHVIKPIIREINALAPFNVKVLPIKTGKRVTHIRVFWSKKTKNEIIDAWSELQRPRVGRKARISDQDVQVLEPSPSINRVTRKTPKTS